ncbi:peptidase G1 [Lophiotrema nucula]|uniref:Peptidase G1 n=1 Tax=Lophiotrema nucula TaxID=690887 RepID=A0A6A5ZJ23_9PLEO|nr:peptidase G1 [Lophiotrema nucula]
MKPSKFLCRCFLLPFVSAAFDQNRGGAVLKAPAGDSFSSVTGTFTIPSLSGPDRLSIWVAIGDTLNQDYVLQGGVKYDNSTLSTFANWFPKNATDTTAEVGVKTNDVITITVSVMDGMPEMGTVVIENRSQNKTTTQTLDAPANINPSKLTALAADWFVQAYQMAGELVQVPSFGTVNFTDVSATITSGKKVGATGAGTFVIQGTSGQQYSSTTVTESTIAVKQQI